MTAPPSDKSYALERLLQRLGLFSDGNGFARYLGGDALTYAAGAARFVHSGSQTVNSNTPQYVGNLGDQGLGLAQADYEFDAQIHCLQGGTASSQSFAVALAGTTTTARTFLTWSFQQEVGAAPNVQMNNAVNAQQNSPAYTAGVRFTVSIRGVIALTSSGSGFGVSVATTNPSNPYSVLGGSRMSLMPV